MAGMFSGSIKVPPLIYLKPKPKPKPKLPDQPPTIALPPPPGLKPLNGGGLPRPKPWFDGMWGWNNLLNSYSTVFGNWGGIENQYANMWGSLWGGSPGLSATQPNTAPPMPNIAPRLGGNVRPPNIAPPMPGAPRRGAASAPPQRILGGLKKLWDNTTREIKKGWDKLTGNLGGLGGTLTGKPDQFKWIPPEQVIMKPSGTENMLLKGLFPLAMGQLGLYRRFDPGKYAKISEGLFSAGFKDTLSGLQWLAREARGLLFSPEIQDAIRAGRGELPDAFEDMIRNQLTNRLGGILNSAAQRGIINSSVVQGAISQALENTLAQRAKYLPLAQELALNPLKTKASLLPMAGELTMQPLRTKASLLPTVSGLITQPFRFAVNTPLGMSGALREVQQGYLSLPANLYSQMMSARHKVSGIPIVQRGSGGLLGALAGGAASGLGAGFGSWLGGKLF